METFLLDNIDHNRADMVYDQLNLNSEKFNELYDRYHRYTEVDASTGALVKEFEAKYFSDVDEAYQAAVKLYATYKKALKLSVKKAKVKLLKAKIANLKESVRPKIDAATEVVESVDDNFKKTAKIVESKHKLSFET